MKVKYYYTYRSPTNPDIAHPYSMVYGRVDYNDCLDNFVERDGKDIIIRWILPNGYTGGFAVFYEDKKTETL